MNLSILQTQLKDLSPTVRASACEELAQVVVSAAKGEDRESIIVKWLMEGLADNDFRVIAATVQSLGTLGERARSAVTKLLELALGEDPSLSINCIEACKKIGTAGIDLTQFGDRFLAHENEAVTYHFFKLAEHIGAEAAPLVPWLIRGLKCETCELVVWQAAEALVAIGPAGNSAEPALIEILRDPDADLHLKDKSVLALRAMGVDLEEKYPELILRNIRERDEAKRYLVSTSLGEDKAWSQEEVDQVVLQWVSSDHISFELTAVTNIKEIDFDRHLNSFLTLSKSKDDITRCNSVSYLSDLARKHPEARNRMIELLNDPCEAVILSVLIGLSSIPYFAKSAQARIEELAKTDSIYKVEAKKLLTLVLECKK